MSAGWTTPEDIAAKVRRRWDDGTLLRAHAQGAVFEPIEMPLRGPKPAQIGDDLSSAQAWVSRLDDGRRGDSRYELQWDSIGGRHIGRNRIPVRAVVSSYQQAWALLGVAGQVRRLDEVLALAEAQPPAHAWVTAQPHRALKLHDEMRPLLSAYRWLQAHRGSGRYLREISVPGVDTKFAERHRSTLAAMLGVSTTPAGFLAGLGLRAKPDFMRLRVATSLGMPLPVSELIVRAEEAAGLALPVRNATVIENEITYLSVPVPEDGVVIWGKGFDVDRVGRLPWLASAAITYWGDLDTYGFAILDRIRAWLPQTRSVLMDRDTLLGHRDRWVIEDRPATSGLTRLTPAEHELYAELVTDAWGKRVRLEQERIDWDWVVQRVPG